MHTTIAMSAFMPTFVKSKCKTSKAFVTTLMEKDGCRKDEPCRLRSALAQLALGEYMDHQPSSRHNRQA